MGTESEFEERIAELEKRLAQQQSILDLPPRNLSTGKWSIGWTTDDRLTVTSNFAGDMPCQYDEIEGPKHPESALVQDECRVSGVEPEHCHIGELAAVMSRRNARQLHYLLGQVLYGRKGVPDDGRL